MVKKVLSLILVILLASFASAISINSPEEIPENSSWGFNITLSSGATATIKIAGEKIAEVYPTAVSFEEEFVSNAFISNNSVYIYHIGLDSGTYSIEVDSSDGTESKNITSIKLANESTLTNLITEKVDGKLEEYDRQFKNIEVDNKEFWKKLNETSEALTSTDSKINSAKTEVSSLTEKLDSANSKINSLESKINAIEQINAEEQAKLVATEEARLLAAEEAKKSPLAGFVNLASDMALPLGGLVVVLLIIGGVFAFKQYLPEVKTIYSGGQEKDEYNLPVSEEDSKIADELIGGSGGKWAFNNEEE